MKPNKWRPFRFARDWEHKYVYARRDIVNGGGQVIPGGALCYVEGVFRGTAHIVSTVSRTYIRRVPIADLRAAHRPDACSPGDP